MCSNMPVCFTINDKRYPNLANSATCRVQYKHRVFSSVDAAYCAASVEGSQPIDDFIYVSSSQAKAMVRNMRKRSDWHSVNWDIMHELVLNKFTNNPTSKKELLSTADTLLIYVNREHDNFWGSCNCSRCADTAGQNELGKILMLVRAELSGNSKVVAEIPVDNELIPINLKSDEDISYVCKKYDVLKFDEAIHIIKDKYCNFV